MFKNDLAEFKKILNSLTKEEFSVLLVKSGIYNEDMSLRESYKTPKDSSAIHIDLEEQGQV